MNIIQISRGNLYKRYKNNVDGKYIDGLKDGELFIQTAPYDEVGPLALPDSVTHKQIYPQIGDLFIGTDTGYTQIGSSQNVIARFVLDKDTSTVNLEDLGPSAITDNDAADLTTLRKKLKPNNIYVYTAEKEFSKDLFIGIDGNPIKLHKKDVFLCLGETKEIDDTGDTKTKEVIIKLSGAGSAAEIEFPKIPEDAKANQVHSWYKAPNLVQALYDIDKIKLSHYESEKFEQFFSAGESKDPETGTIRKSLTREYPNLTKIRFIRKTELLKRLVWLYTNEEPKEDLGFQVARIQGTEFKVWKSDDIKNEDGSTSENPNNYPIAVIDDCRPDYSQDKIDEILGSVYEQTEEGFKLGNANLNKLFIQDKRNNPVCLFYPGDEIIIKIRNTAANLDKYIEEHTDKENGAIYIDYSNSQFGNTAWQNADYNESTLEYTHYDQVEITRRGALGNPNTNPGENYPDGLPPDETPTDGPESNSKYRRANEIANRYWEKEDKALKTDAEAIKHLYHTKADVDINGKIFLSQLPQTVVGGMQRRSSINNIKAFLTVLCKFDNEDKLNGIFKDADFVDNLYNNGYEASFKTPLVAETKSHIFEWAENANFLKRAVLVDKNNDVALEKEDRKLGDLIPSIDVGDYFIYTGEDISFEDLEEDDGQGGTRPTESTKRNKNALEFYFDVTNENGETTHAGDNIGFKEEDGEPKFRVGQFIKALLNDSAQKISGLHTGDIIVVDKIKPAKPAGIRPGDEQEINDTEDGYVTQISIIPSTSSSVSSFIVNGQEVTGALELAGNKRLHKDYDNKNVVETSIRLDGKKIIVEAKNAVLMTTEPDRGPIEPEGTFYTLCDSKFAHPTNFKYNNTEEGKNWLSLSDINNVNNVKWETEITTKKTNVEESYDEAGNKIYKVISEPEEKVTTEHKTQSNEFFKFNSKADNYGSLSLGIGVSTNANKDAHQIFQGKSGVIALLEDLYEALNFDPHAGITGDDGDDTDPKKLEAIAEEMSHWHQRTHYYVVLDEEAREADPEHKDHYKFKVEFENSTLRDVVNDEKDPDAINDTVTDKNFVKNWDSFNDSQDNDNYQKGDKGEVKQEKTRAFQFYYEENKNISFVAATKSDQSTFLEGADYNEIKEDVDVVQTIPLHSGVLLNSNSVIDCGEWV